MLEDYDRTEYVRVECRMTEESFMKLFGEVYGGMFPTWISPDEKVFFVNTQGELMGQDTQAPKGGIYFRVQKFNLDGPQAVELEAIYQRHRTPMVLARLSLYRFDPHELYVHPEGRDTVTYGQLAIGVFPGTMEELGGLEIEVTHLTKSESEDPSNEPEIMH